MLLVAAAVVVAVQALGSLLVVAVLVAPAACARLLTRRLAPMLWLSVAVAIAGGVAASTSRTTRGTAGGRVDRALPRRRLPGRDGRRLGAAPSAGRQQPVSVNVYVATNDVLELTVRLLDLS